MIGARVGRREDSRLLAGGGRYLADVQLDGELHLAFVRSPLAHASILSIDAEAAHALDGVRAVRLGGDVAEVCEGIVGELAVDGIVATTMPLLARDVVRYVGEPVVAIVADTRALAEDACQLVSLELEPLEPVVDPLAARDGLTTANETLPGNIGLRGGASFGDPDAAFAAAETVASATYRTGRLSATPIETRGCIARYEWTSGELTLWTSSQMPHYVQYCLSAYLGFPEHSTEVRTPDTGGGFGQKAHLFVEELLVALLSRELRRPVKWVEDRRENLLAATHAHEQIIELSYALDPDGKILSQRMSATGDGGAYHQPPWSMAVEPWCTAVVNPTGIYDIPTYAYQYEAIATNKCPIGAYRGVGYMAGVFAHEVLADEAARQFRLTPFEFRRRNVVRTFPWTNGSGITYEEGSWAETIDALEELVQYDAHLARQRELLLQGRYVGLGISVFVESSGESTAMSQAHGLGDTYYDSATVKMEPQGTVVVTTGLTTQGQGNRTTMAQIAADILGVRYEDVLVRCGESTSYGYGSGTVGSRAAVVAGGAVARSCDVVRRKLVAVAANLLEASVDDVLLADGHATVVGSPDRAVSVSEIATSIYFDAQSWPEDFDPSLEITSNYDPARPIFSNGAHAFAVEVDVETGLVHVERAYAVEDCGTMINPTIVEGQIRGGMTQGLGAALFEELVYDEQAQLTSTTLADYLLPTADVVPDFELRHLETPSSHTPAGIKGMGESGLIASPAALVNAVNDALAPLGVTMRQIPMTPERILTAIEAARVG
jgi:carbon-monoxide dehydrogenase large subunit